MLGRLIGGRYELLKKIGGGGMAIVYKARCHLLNRDVAVKILRLELVEDEEFVARFRRESQSAASLSHPNIVEIYDVGEEEDIHYIVMEYVSGGTLKDYIKSSNYLHYEQIIKIAIDISSAIEHAHKNKIVHRDIKPQNILMGQDGNIKVADFGIARAVTSATVTAVGSDVMGSVHYFSPEQARGGYVDEKSDIYSLGVVMYEMCTGEVPFNGDSAISIALKHIQNDIIWPEKMDNEIPSALKAIVNKALEKELCLRYQSINELIADLKRAISEPEGDFVTRNLSSDMPTQAIGPIGETDEIGRTHKGSGKSKRAINLLRFIPFIFLIAFLTFLGIKIYRANFVTKEEIVPDIRDVSYDEASELTNDMDIELNIIARKNNRDIEEGNIISQDPKPGDPIEIPGTIDVVISLGPKTIVVPDVMGKPEKEAIKELENKGLEVASIEYKNDDEYPKGVVIRQSIQHGVEVLDSTTIELAVSDGPTFNTVKVSGYTGMLLELAIQSFERDGLQKGEIYKEYSEDVPQGVVIRQRPVEGVYVEKDRKVDLWISDGKEPNYPKKLEITLWADEYDSEKVPIRVERVDDGSIVYEKEHLVEEQVIVIPMEQEGVVDYNIYVDNRLKRRVTIDYTKKEGG
ncbi:MAG: Stk1 family PASTA domain-containing Ser/Thr kinase [Clostridiales bacterium]|nr:Stk1 family PASTA domain-containing Ser/Thr kinase [Clostridiales bacterium]